MNKTESEPITGPGLLWALGQINKRFEQAAEEQRALALKKPEELPPNATEGV